jgi:DNA (cytosine-5)-methyltransferase 1
VFGDNCNGYVADTIGCGQSGSGQLGQPSDTEACGVGQANRPDDDCAGHWQTGIWIDCPDGKQRLIEPSICLLAHGVPNRVGKLRGYGNAIVPQVAATFIKAATDGRI